MEAVIHLVDVHELSGKEAEYWANGMCFRGYMRLDHIGNTVFLTFEQTRRLVHGVWVEAYDSWSPFPFSKCDAYIERLGDHVVLVTHERAYYIVSET